MAEPSANRLEMLLKPLGELFSRRAADRQVEHELFLFIKVCCRRRLARQ
jgi:hypothetical protein